jgi:hypothetical protein
MRMTLRRWNKVLAEQAFLDPRFQVLVRRGDDPHVGLDRRMAADAVEMPVGQHAQQAGLQFGRHVADFVEEQRAALGLLEAPAALRLAPVKAPRSWPKSSDSSRSRGIAAVLMAMKGLSARGLWRCRARATSSLPEPDSPVISTVACDRPGGRWRGRLPAWPAPGRGFPAPGRLPRGTALVH